MCRVVHWDKFSQEIQEAPRIYLFSHFSSHKLKILLILFFDFHELRLNVASINTNYFVFELQLDFISYW